jgi:hypothetical protein
VRLSNRPGLEPTAAGPRAAPTSQAAPEEVTSRPGHVAVMSPHRAQCAALSRALLPPPLPRPVAADAAGAGRALPAPYRMIDTVEKLQGQEAPAVLYSATASCPAALAANADFYASLSRCNVALSRARERLVVVASEAMLGFAPPGAARYRDLVLWKELRRACSAPLGAARVLGHDVRVFGAPAARRA